MDTCWNARMDITLSLSSPWRLCVSLRFLPWLLSSLGSCAHRGLQKVSRPFVVQLNWRGSSHKAGVWGRDSGPNPDSFLYWVAPLSSDDRWVQDGFHFATSFIPNVLHITLTGFFMAPAELPLSILGMPLDNLGLGQTGHFLDLLSGLRMAQMALSYLKNPLSEISNPIINETGSICSLI